MLKEIPSRVRGLLEGFIRERLTGETFSNYWGRTHVNGTKATPEQFHIEAQRPGELVTPGKKRTLRAQHNGCVRFQYNLRLDAYIPRPGARGWRGSLPLAQPTSRHGCGRGAPAAACTQH